MGGAEGGPERAAGVGVEPARDVERHARAGLGVEGLDPARVAALDRAAEADAEEGVDHQCPAVGRGGGEVGDDAAAGGEVVGMRLRRLGRQALGRAAEGDHHLAPGLGELARHHEAVATVVAGAAGDEDRPGAIHDQPHRVLRGGASGTLHQRRAGVRDELVLDLADAGDGVDRTQGAEHGELRLGSRDSTSSGPWWFRRRAGRRECGAAGGAAGGGWQACRVRRGCIRGCRRSYMNRHAPAAPVGTAAAANRAVRRVTWSRGIYAAFAPAGAPT